MSRPNRTDWTFVDEKAGRASSREATSASRRRSRATALTRFREFVHVPEAWTRDYEQLRSKNEAAGPGRDVRALRRRSSRCSPSSSRKIVRKDVPWKLVGGLRRHRVRARAALDAQRPAADAVRLRHGEPALGVPDRAGRAAAILGAIGDRRRHRDRRRRGRADLPRALSRARSRSPAPSRCAGSRRRRSSAASCSATRWSPSSSPTRRCSTSWPRISAPGRRPTCRTATCSTPRLPVGHRAPHRLPAGRLRGGHQPDVLDLLPRPARRRARCSPS